MLTKYYYLCRVFNIIHILEKNIKKIWKLKNTVSAMQQHCLLFHEQVNKYRSHLFSTDVSHICEQDMECMPHFGNTD